MENENSFLKGAAILSIAGVIVKVLGAIYRIPLSNIIKSEGMGYYQTAYPFYTLLLTISTAGFPVAIAKIVSERRSLGQYKNANKVFRVALSVLSLVGLVSSVYLYFNAEKIVLNLQNSKAYYALVSLWPALIFVPIMSVFRGYFQGMQNMVPTAISQIFEQLFRVVFGLGLTVLVLDQGLAKAAGAASLGASIGALAGTLSIIFIYLRRKSSIQKEIEAGVLNVDYSSQAIIRDLFKIAIPITIGASIVPIMDYIDLKIVLKRLQLIGYTETGANDLYGNLKGMAQTLINLPQVFAVAISMSLVPAVSQAKISKDLAGLKKHIGSGLKITALIGFPAAIGLFILAKPIISMLYFKNTAETINNTGNILMVLSLGVIFLTLVQSLSAILQGLGNPLVPAVGLFIGALVKAVLTYRLTVIPSINIYGAAISTVIAYLIAGVFDLMAINRFSGVALDYKDIFLGPLLSALGMGVAVFGTFELASLFLGDSLATLVAILIGVVAYVFLLFKTRVLSEEEILLLPKGHKIVSFIKKRRK